MLKGGTGRCFFKGDIKAALSLRCGLGNFCHLYFSVPIALTLWWNIDMLKSTGTKLYFIALDQFTLHVKLLSGKA